MESLSDIYSNWLYAQNILTVLQRNFSDRDLYEARNIMERYLISYYNDEPEAEKKMLSEFREKKIQWFPYERRNVSLQLFGTAPRAPAGLKAVLTANSLMVGKFTTAVTDRMNFLIDHYGLETIAKVYLAYDSILAGSQHWGVPWATADVLFNHGFTNEGFASPLNSRYIDKISVDGNRGNYCSLFYWLDPDSLGNFFDVDLLAYPGSWSINPPMIEALIEELTDKVLAACQAGSYQLTDQPADRPEYGKAYFISMSNWSDMPAYQRLSDSPYLREKRILPKGHYYYQTPTKEIIKANFDSVYFILADVDYPEIPPALLDAIWSSWLLSAEEIAANKQRQEEKLRQQQTRQQQTQQPSQQQSQRPRQGSYQRYQPQQQQHPQRRQSQTTATVPDLSKSSLQPTPLIAPKQQQQPLLSEQSVRRRQPNQQASVSGSVIGNNVAATNVVSSSGNTITPLLIQEVTEDDRHFYVINDAEKYQAGSKERGLPELVRLSQQYGDLIYAGPEEWLRPDSHL